MRRLLYRIGISNTTVPTFCFITLLAAISLSILNSFQSPLPIRPRSSIGLIDVSSFLFFLCVVYTNTVKKIINSNVYGIAIDIVVLLFACINLVSLLFADRIYEQINIRCLITAIAMFYALRKYSLSKHQITTIIHWVGGFTVLIASLSILQMIFPDFLNTFAYKYFSSKDTYGLLNDFFRGRLLHWGNIILTFPFFYVSYILFRKQYRRPLVNLYGIFGFSTILMSMVASNFRWTAFVFFIVSIFFAVQAVRHDFLSKKNIVYSVAVICITGATGLIFAKVFFGYNMIDRLLIKNPDRDWNETTGRLQLFNQAIGLFNSSPIIGVGTGNYLHLVDQYHYVDYFNVHDQVQTITAPAAAHNEFFTIASETGVVGLLLFVLFVFLTMRESYMRMRSYPEKGQNLNFIYPLLIFSSYFSFCMYVMFENIYPHNYLFLFFLSGSMFSWFSRKKIGGNLS